MVVVTADIFTYLLLENVHSLQFLPCSHSLFISNLPLLNFTLTFVELFNTYSIVYSKHSFVWNIFCILKESSEIWMQVLDSRSHDIDWPAPRCIERVSPGLSPWRRSSFLCLQYARCIPHLRPFQSNSPRSLPMFSL